MPSAKVDVAVRSDGNVVEVLRRRPVRVLPTGTAGVVYAGEVFPLYAGDTINLGDRSYSKAECNSFVRAGQPIPYASATESTSSARLDVGRWNIEHNRFGNYLVFDADEGTAEAVATLMEDVGLGVIRWDVSSRPAEDGYHYDWFVRLGFQGSGEDAYSRVAGALSSAGAEETPRSVDAHPEIPGQAGQISNNADEHARLTQLMGIVEGLFASVDEWRTAHEKISAKAAQLERNLADALKAVRQQRQTAVDEQRLRLAAEAELAARRAVSDGAEADSQSSLAEAVRQVEARASARIKQADEDRRAAEQLGEEAEENASNQRARVRQLEAELTRMGAALAAAGEDKQFLESYISELSAADEEKAKLREAGKARQTSSGRTSADRFAEQVLPRLTLSPEALETLVAMKDPSKVFAVLSALNLGEPIAATPFKGVSAGNLRIKEIDRHLHIGNEGKASDMGRVYYCRAGDRVFAHVHRKQNDNEQRQTVERFAGWCRDQIKG